jgi:glycosyltransferase involved in cell wall biosynthesis
MVRVSIIIPCFNRQDLLGETLDSVRAQTYPHWEAIVVDDASQDQSLEVARQYAREDGRFQAVSRQGALRGANVCRNQGLSLAAGEFVIFLDSDDLLSTNCLENRVAALDQAPQCGFGVFQTELFKETVGDIKKLWNAYTDSSDLSRFLSLDTVWLTTGPIWRKQAIEQLGGFDEDLLSFQDWALHLRALIAGVKYFKEHVPDNFHRYEYGGTAITAIMTKHPDHLISHEKIFCEILGYLRLAGLFDDETRRRVTGLFWWLALRWCVIFRISDADRVWRRAFNLGLCTNHQYLEGRILIKLKRIRGSRFLIRYIQPWLWPKEYYRLFSAHLCNTPIKNAIRLVNSSEPKVSIGFPVYNAEARIERALDSLLGQDFKNFELVISDNASTDGTKSICERYAQQDKRIRYFRNESNIGVNPNHDRVFELSKGKYFAWFADDIEYLSGMLSRCVQAIETAPASVVMIYPRCEMIRDGKITVDDDVSIQSSDPQPYKRLETVIRHVVMVNQFYGLVKREALAKTRLNGLYASSDFVLLAELAMLGEIWEFPEKLIRRRIDSNRGTAAVFRDGQAWKVWSGAVDQGLINRYLSNRERLAIEYLRGAWHVPIKPMDKLKCLMRILPVYYARTSPKARFVLKLLNPWQWKRKFLNSLMQRKFSN